MGNSGDVGAEMYAITPALTDLSAGTHRMKFFAKKSAGATLEIGTMTDPTDAGTFTSVEIISATTTHDAHPPPRRRAPASPGRPCVACEGRAK